MIKDEAIEHFGKPSYERHGHLEYRGFWFAHGLYLREDFYEKTYYYARLVPKRGKLYIKSTKFWRLDELLPADVQVAWEMSRVDDILLGVDDGD